jgi:translocation and assembly module TamA
MLPGKYLFDTSAPSIATLWLAASLGVGAPAFSQDSQPQFRVTIIAPEAVKRTLERNLSIVKWTTAARTTSQQFRRQCHASQQEIEQLMAASGYYSPRASARLAEEGQAVLCEVEVEPGEPTLVGAVTIEFSGAIAQADAAPEPSVATLRTSWSLKPGEVFRHEAWESAKRDLLRRVTAYRYPAAVLAESGATVDPPGRRADLRVVVDSGPAVTVGEPRIRGLSRYPENIVRRLNPLSAGAAYSREALLDYQVRLLETGYFGSVVVETPVDPELPQSVPIEVTVVEKEARAVGFGIGYSTDTGPRVQATYDDNNLFGRAWRLASALKLATREQSANAEILLPLDEDGYRDGFGASLKREDVSGTTTAAGFLGARRSWGSARTEHGIALEYRREETKIAGSRDDLADALSLTYSLTLRRTDHILFPGRGYLANFQLGGAPLGAVADEPFLRLYGRYAHFFSVGANGTLIARAEAGIVTASTRIGIPQTLLFRTGGAQSVRGYSYQSLGVPEGAAIVGGRYLAVGSVEYVHWLNREWGAAVFYDVGDAADEPKDLDPVHGRGIGVRWKSPVGPVQFDLAHGRETGKLRFHFSLGFTF